MNAKPTLMHQPVMGAAQKQQVLQFSLATIRPVLNVMGVYETGAGTAWKAATTIAALQCPANGRWDGAGLAPDT